MLQVRAPSFHAMPTETPKVSQNSQFHCETKLHPDGGGSRHLRNASNFLQDHKVC